MIQCEIYIYSTADHAELVYTGFTLLAARGEIQLTYNFNQYSRYGITPMQFVKPHDLQGVFVVINQGKTIFYDTSDGENLIEAAAQVSDMYFKRSYRQSAIPDKYKESVFPFGLNYQVHAGMFDRNEFYRLFFSGRNYTKSPKELLKWILRNISIKYNPTIKNMNSLPQPNQDPRVLFMSRTWDPDNCPYPIPDKYKEIWKQECISINETRASVIKILRKELADRFYGGFSQSTYSLKHYKDSLLKDNKASRKENYMKILRKHPICIATTGLHNSISWKFAEYIAFSKAIVSEKLYFTVPGNLEAGKNYLEFNNAEECVKQTLNLFEDKILRAQMMENNYDYYKKYLLPDKIILRTLNIALNA
ncbi:MAG: hypothetical protein JWR54_3915 [Mucilaginibacter sp.]|nr:hypothetical protein [Mucilaginibacter sp.]